MVEKPRHNHQLIDYDLFGKPFEVRYDTGCPGCTEPKAMCVYCSGERGPVVEGTGLEATCAACREDGGPSAGRDYWDRPDPATHPEFWSE